jgi:peptidoglycan/xylan/chitin deacetylase (PgdA/CDA1 family)
MRLTALLSAAFFFVTPAACPPALRAQSPPGPPARTREIAVTIDDLPLNGPQFDAARLRAMTDKLLSGIRKHQIPAVGFVNESLLYVGVEADARIAILRAWSEAGVELGNHTFSHLGFKEAAPADYRDDFVRGDAVTRLLLGPKGQRPRYFRHPFLQMGPTAELEQAFRSFIAARGYRAAPVTVDTMDWMFLAAYAKARAAGDAATLRRVSDEYIKYVGVKFDFCERVSEEMFGRPVSHILLLHANELNADNFDALAGVMKGRGYRFVTLEQALGDPVYRFPEKYAATSDWLSHWAVSKGHKFDPPMPSEFIQKQFATQ